MTPLEGLILLGVALVIAVALAIGEPKDPLTIEAEVKRHG